MTVKKPEELKQVTEDMLAGLSATDELKKKILYNAANNLLMQEDAKNNVQNNENKEIKKGWLRFVPAMCCCLAILICASVLIPKFTETAKPDDHGFMQINENDTNYDMNSEECEENNLPKINDMVAGNYVVSEEKPVLASTKINKESSSVKSDSKSSIFMNTVPLAEKGASADLQLVSLEGKFYRLTSDMFLEGCFELGNEAGTVTFSGDYTEFLNNGKVNGSTFLKEGTKLSFIKGMNKSFVTAEYDGKYIVFERVSVENRGLLSGEKLEDIIPDFDHVIRIEFSDREDITDTDKIREIGNLLKEDTTMENSGAVSSGDQMILVMDNQIRYQFILDGERICSCGTWVCPELFELIAE